MKDNKIVVIELRTKKINASCKRVNPVKLFPKKFLTTPNPMGNIKIVG